MKTPSEKQIAFATDICEVLGINFPTNSDEYTAKTFYNFIKSHIDQYNIELSNSLYEPDDLYLLCENDVWTEYY